jgi:hypothetical protein
MNSIHSTHSSTHPILAELTHHELLIHHEFDSFNILQHDTKHLQIENVHH